MYFLIRARPHPPLIRAMPERKHFFFHEVFPYQHQHQNPQARVHPDSLKFVLYHIFTTLKHLDFGAYACCLLRVLPHLQTQIRT